MLSRCKPAAPVYTICTERTAKALMVHGLLAQRCETARQTAHDPEKLAFDVIGGVKRFSDKIMRRI
jgi:methyl coenzyme M reductase alpha subunit